MATLTPQFSSERMVRQYVEKLYAPAAAAYRLADHCRVASDVQRWREMIANYWSDVSFGALHVEPAGAGHDFRVLVSLGAIGPDAVQVQLYAPPGKTVRPNGYRSNAATKSFAGRTATTSTSKGRDRPRNTPSRRAVSPGRVVSARSRQDLLVRPASLATSRLRIRHKPAIPHH